MFNLGLGGITMAKVTKLFDRITPDGLSHAATDFVESLKINSISEKKRKGRWVVVKRRNLYGARGAELINFYFRLADIPVRFVNDVRTWCRWEAKCFRMLNGDRFHASISDSRTLILDKLPGHNLWDRMKAGTLTLPMVKAAGKEYRRAHEMHSEELGGGWSHGDASMTNVVYDEKTDRARLVDFEIMHDKSLPALSRHADDLLVFLLDLAGRVVTRQWLPFATTFLIAYGNRAVLRELKNHLIVPSGLALIWWNVRTNFAKNSQINNRFHSLQRAMAKLDLYRSAGIDQGRQKRRASINGQVPKPGMPMTKSRQRTITEIPKAMSLGRPTRSLITR
jgi:hypothetical protein